MDVVIVTLRFIVYPPLPSDHGPFDWRFPRPDGRQVERTELVSSVVARHILSDYGSTQQRCEYVCCDGSPLVVDWANVIGLDMTNDLTYANGA